MDDPALLDFDRPPRASRRTLLLGGTALCGLVVAGSGWALRRRAAARSLQAAALAQSAYAKLRSGNVLAALRDATDARALSPDGTQAAYAWLHAAGLSLLEEMGGAKEAVGFVDEARRMGAEGAELAFATVVAAVAMKNDKLAMRLVAQHEAQGLAASAFYDFAAGAAHDLACDRGAVVRYAASAAKWADAVLPRYRLARAEIMRGRPAAAREALSGVPADAVAARILAGAASRLEGGPATPFDPAALDQAPRSVRPLGVAVLLRPDDPLLGIDAAVDDVDSPLLAIACGRIALLAEDVESAERAAAAAHRMRPELTESAELRVRVALARGDLAKARAIADEASDPGVSALVAAVEGYEAKDPAKIRDAVAAAVEAGASAWPLANEARGLLGDGPRPASPEDAPLKAASLRREPWADIVVFDLCLSDRQIERAKSIMKTWRELTPPREKRAKLVAELGTGKTDG
jgi:hypothetical protein